jgi:hypothetical protein
MKKSIILLVFMFNVVFSYAQFTNYTPFIPEIPTSSKRYLDDMDAMNRSLLNYIVDLQSKILDMKLQTNDSGLLEILNRYYRKLEGYKSYGPVMFQQEATIKETSLKLKEELVNYKSKTQQTNVSKNSEPVFEAGFISSSYVENEWNNNLGKFEVKGEINITSYFYLTNNTISFKKGNNDWLINRWKFVSTEEESGITTFRDERNQLILINSKKNILFYFYEPFGDNYKYMTAYTKYIDDNSVKPPFINNPEFQKVK